jgi:2-carboxy-1,4-naphthoquinone phytyltransferase
MTPQFPERSVRQKLWLAALKPPMYSVAIMPILWGTAIAYAEQRTIDWRNFGAFLIGAVLILIWENLANDVFDSETGVDVNKHHSLVNLTGNKALIFAIGNACLGLGISGIIAIALWQQDPTVLLMVLGCCAIGYVYQGPPFRLSYKGVGEILCFFAFGPLAVGAAYYSQAQSISPTAWVASIVLGITTSLILFCSHFHQIKDDFAVGKLSPIVRLGTKRSAELLPVFCGIVYGTIGLLVGLKWAPIGVLLTVLSIPVAVQLCRHVGEFHDQPDRVMNCKFIAVNLHFWSGILFAIGFVVSRY